VNDSPLTEQTISYYLGHCKGDDPLFFMDGLRILVDDAAATGFDLVGLVCDQNTSALIQACGPNGVYAVNTINELASILSRVSTELNTTFELTSCDRVLPLLDRLLQDPTCTSSVAELTWMFSTLCALSFVTLVILTIRAAMFNPVIAKRKRSQSEQEFEEYKEYMSHYYDTSQWKIDSEGKMKDLKPVETFETEQSSAKSDSSEESEYVSTRSPQNKAFEPVTMTPLTRAAIASGKAAAADVAKRRLMAKTQDTFSDNDEDASSCSQHSSSSLSFTSCHSDLNAESISTSTNTVSALVDRFFRVRRSLPQTKQGDVVYIHKSNEGNDGEVIDIEYYTDTQSDCHSIHELNTTAIVTLPVDVYEQQPPCPPKKKVKSLGRTSGAALYIS
jgi:hypothetical protein